MENIVVNILEDSLILLITLLVRFILTSYVIALIPIDILQTVSSGQQNILANLTTTEVTYISNSTIEFNVVLPHIIDIFAILTFIFLILDIVCYLKAKWSKHSLN
jgi:large-conductance mechanosensitive channel